MAEFEYKIKDEEVCITKYVGSSKEVVIPEKIEGFPVTSVGEYAFSNNKLTSIDLSGVGSIGEFAFSYNKLTSIDLSGVGSIGIYAFWSNKLTSINLSSIKSISYGAFCNNNLTSIDLSAVKSIDDCAFRSNNLTSIDLSGIKSIGNYAFRDNKLTSVDFSGVKSIGYGAFWDNNLEAIILPEKFRVRTKEIFDFDEEELDNRNKKYVKKYVDKMRELYMKKLYKNSRKHGLIFEYITYYTYRRSYDGMLKEAIKNIDCSVVCF